MRKIKIILLFFLLLFIVSACSKPSPDLGKYIIGKWQNKQVNEIITFTDSKILLSEIVDGGDCDYKMAEKNEKEKTIKLFIKCVPDESTNYDFISILTFSSDYKNFELTNVINNKANKTSGKYFKSE